MITTRYAVTLPAPLRLTSIALTSFQAADLEKKIDALRWAHLNLNAHTPQSAQEQQVIALGAGNPRLLERLYQVLAATRLDAVAIFEPLAAKAAAFREELLLQTLLNYQTLATRQLCATLALFDIAMPKALLEAIEAITPAELETSLQAAIAVGLIEANQQHYFISRLLQPLVADEWDAEQQENLYAQAAVCLEGLWWESDYQINNQEGRELVRIAKLGDEKVIFSKVAGSLAHQLYEQCAYDEAQGWYVELLPIRQALGDREGEGVVLNHLALIHVIHGEHDCGLTYHHQALAISRELDDKQGECATLNNLAAIAYNQGNLTYLSDALKISQETDDKQGEGLALNNISQIYKARGNYDTALHYLSDALKIRQEIGDKQGEGTSLNNLATIALDQCDYDIALRYLSNALKIQQDIGDKLSEGATLSNIARVYRHGKKDNDTAFRYLNDSLKIRQAIGDKQGEGAVLNNISQIYHDKGSYDIALHDLNDSLIIRQKTGDKPGECSTYFNIGHTLLKMDDHIAALAFWLEAYKIAKAIGEAKVLAGLEGLAKDLGGLDYWEKLTP